MAADWLTVSEVKERLRVKDRATVYSLIKAKKLVAVRRGGSGQWLVSAGSVAVLLDPGLGVVLRRRAAEESVRRLEEAYGGAAGLSAAVHARAAELRAQGVGRG